VLIAPPIVSASIACRALQAKHRWCITGTPLLISISEMYPYLAFLREPNTGSYKIFKENFCSPNDPDGKDKLGVILRKVMIRRSHMDRMFDAKLVNLPTPSESTIWLELNDVERAIYEIVKTRFIEHINSISKKGRLKGSYSHIWVLILRLRQLCAHSLMIGQTCLDLLEREDYERLNALTSSEDTITDDGAALLVHLRQVLRDSVNVKEVDATSSIFMNHNEREAYATGLVDVYCDEEQIGNAFGLNFRFKRFLDDYKHSEHFDSMQERTTCCGCRQKPSDPYLTSCLHVYCHSCLQVSSKKRSLSPGAWADI
jgi:SNF2 family DNA or RNA helicase